MGSTYLSVTQIVLVSQHIAIPEHFPYQYALGQETYDQFLGRTVSSYQAYRFIENNISRQPKILSLDNDSRLYTNARIFDYNSKEGWDLFHSSSDSDWFANQLKQLRYTHLLVFTPEIYSRPGLYKTEALSDEFLYKHTNIIYAHNQTLVYQLIWVRLFWNDM